MKFEELARRSSAAARTSVSRLDPPSIGEPRRPRWLAPALAGTAVAAVVVGGLVLIDRDGGGETPAPAAIPVVAEPPRLALDDVADEWTQVAAGPMDEFQVGAVPTFQYYGDGRADDPFADRDLLIGWIDQPEDTTPIDGEPLTIRGTAGFVSEGADEFGFEATLVNWREETAGGALDVIAASRNIPRDELLAIVEGLAIDAAATSVTPSDELGLDLLTTSSDFPVIGLRGSNGWMVTYYGQAGPTTSDPFVTLTSVSGDLADDRLLLRWWSDELRTVDVGGGEAYLAVATPDDDPTGRQQVNVLAWSPEPGIVATLRFFGDGEVDLVALSERVVELGPAEWAELVASTASPDLDDDPDDYIDGPEAPDEEIVAEGGGDVDGEPYTWRLVATSFDLCLDISTAESGSGICSESETNVPPPGSARVVLVGGDDRRLAVVAVANPAVQSLRPLDDRVSVERVEWNGASWFVAIGPLDADDRFEVVRAGDVVETISSGIRPIAPAPPVGVEGDLTDVELTAAGFLADIDWGVGRIDTGLCLYTGGAVDSVSCNDDGDIAVFPTIRVGEADWTFVYVRHDQRCPVLLDTGDDPIVEGGGFGVDAATGDAWTVTVVAGESDGWQVIADGPTVALPQRVGTVAWPDGHPCTP